MKVPLLLLKFICALSKWWYRPSQQWTLRTFQTVVTRVVFQSTSFTHPLLTDHEMNEGCKTIIDSGADTCVVGRHAHIIEFIEGKEISANSWNGQKTGNLRIANAAFAFDSPSVKRSSLSIINPYMREHN